MGKLLGDDEIHSIDWSRVESHEKLLRVAAADFRSRRRLSRRAGHSISAATIHASSSSLYSAASISGAIASRRIHAHVNRDCKRLSSLLDRVETSHTGYPPAAVEELRRLCPPALMKLLESPQQFNNEMSNLFNAAIEAMALERADDDLAPKRLQHVLELLLLQEMEPLAPASYLLTAAFESHLYGLMKLPATMGGFLRIAWHGLYICIEIWLMTTACYDVFTTASSSRRLRTSDLAAALLALEFHVSDARLDLFLREQGYVSSHAAPEAGAAGAKKNARTELTREQFNEFLRRADKMQKAYEVNVGSTQ